jgi:formylglycine-generating enzyme required for sulfatase activity
MDYVEGEDLQAMLDNGGLSPLPEIKVIPWIEQVCDALTYLHSQSPPVVHRDIKPSNIKITPGGEAMLVDFGIAKEYTPGQHTTLGARAVTPGYSPPEQYVGGTDIQSDIYALGATLYTLLTGEIPPASVDIMSGLSEPPQPVDEINPEVSSEVSAAVSQAMQLQRSVRTQSAAEFKSALSPDVSPPPVVQTAETEFAPAPYVSETESVPPTPVEVPSRQISWKYIIAGLLLIPRKYIIGGLLLIIVLAAVFFGGNAIKDRSDERAANQTATSQALVVIDDSTATSTALSTSTFTVEPPTPTQPEATSAPTLTPTTIPVVLPLRVKDDAGVMMGLVPGGKFDMGSSDGEADEQPLHTVMLGAFYIDPYEVTNARYIECVNAGKCDPPTNNSSHSHKNYFNAPQYGDFPVMNVGWEQAKAYCEWRGARLPTEAEWEKAARGGLLRKSYPWGDEAPICQPGLENGAKFDDGNDCSGTDTEAVGSYSANAYGLYDMAGNLWEWVADTYAVDYYAGSPSENPEGPLDGEQKVIRGGSWADSEQDALRVANREREIPTAGSTGIGFRCVREAANMVDLIQTAEAGPYDTVTPTSTETPIPTNTYKPLPPTATLKPTKKPKPTEPPEPPTPTPAP